MLDDLAEIALELGGEVVGAVLERVWEKKKGSKQEVQAKRSEPWDEAEKKLPWEE